MISEIWASTDSPYTCLKDVERTRAFRDAIEATVRPGDVVVDAGAGMGILSFFAAAAGAAQVFAVEIDGVLSAALRSSVSLNALDDRITVVAGDAVSAPLPLAVDVFIGELLETGLIDEEQVRVVNALRARGVIGERTRLIPERYATFAELVAVDNEFYGYRIAAPFHEWPNYLTDGSRWHPTHVRPLSNRADVATVDFYRTVEPEIDCELVLTGKSSGRANAVRLTGLEHLTHDRSLGQTNAVNGDKILQLPDIIDVEPGTEVQLRIRYTMGGGLRSLRLEAAAAVTG
jgi:SAM-dependent methyltransferase